MVNKKLNWSGFARKTPAERAAYLKEHKLLSDDSQQLLADEELLSLSRADQITENVIGRLALPFSIAPDFLINHQVYQVPFVTEEPSVVAAASFAAQIIKRSGGFTARIHSRQMVGQLAIYDVTDKEKAQEAILAQKSHLLSLANQAYPSIVKRGGGACDLSVEAKDDLILVYLTVDTKEAMGANIINTMTEALASPLEELSRGRTLLAVLSNYAVKSLVTAECQIKLRFLSRNKEQAQVFARKIALASQLAQADVYRASTHNKGIFNGIDAVVLATGNDWRAIEAGAHAYACKDGQYRGLSTWTYDSDENSLKGQLTLPMPIATKGGSIGLNPSVRLAHDLLGEPSAKELAQIIASVGLAQNFAALKALTSTGIQAGHMKLQAKSLALSAGAKEGEVAAVVSQLIETKPMNLEKAKAILSDLRQQNAHSSQK
ncbi:hydroxymethylglutaryl-CoA reductase, degradative [Streptococcus pantholopis]|uniref:3-hydroxy-3-methylglutaryl coenzyme A reductase n=1 Tax=Streptococcus pantholopis TaxID=1811193 RepID=A0A172Q6X2_9STRE|nr:hydroxymethylglutaryl-CoA reductase, degradative [Streptococcus pantholopis]AND79214.1 3-hydroxy-3-methylglutaryl-CoA reductase [Streptococcus pantholopis]